MRLGAKKLPKSLRLREFASRPHPQESRPLQEAGALAFSTRYFEAHLARPGGHRHLTADFHRCQVEPEAFAVGQIGKSKPVQHFGLIAADQKLGNGRGAVHEVYPAALALPLDEESPYPMTRYAVKFVVASGKRETNEPDQLLPATCKVPAQPQQALAMFAKGVHPDGERPTIGPAGQIALEMHGFVLPVSRGITSKENG